jgi:hypothetical protein
MKKVVVPIFGRVLVFLVAVVCNGPRMAAEGCLVWTDTTYGYSICLPAGWHHRTMPSGALFLCDNPKGACTTAVGGGPLLGHAIASLVPAQVVLGKLPATSEAFAHEVAKRDPSSQFSDLIPVVGRFAAIRYLVVMQVYTTGGKNEMPQQICRYFVQSDRQLVELILSFNSGDRRSEAYRNTALEIVLSLRPK